MGNPQLEDGYIKIANELFDALIKLNIPSESRRMFDFIMRKTYGYNKKQDRISTKQFIEAINIPRRSVERARKRLKDLNLIHTVKNDGTHFVTYSINKFYKTWVVPSKLSVPSKSVVGTVKKCSMVPSKSVDLYRATKDNTKDNIQKKGKNEVHPHFYRFWNFYPKKLGFGLAKGAFSKLDPDEELLNKMMGAVAVSLKTENWKKEGGKYIPLASKWIEQERWNDDPNSHLNATKPKTSWDNIANR